MVEALLAAICVATAVILAPPTDRPSRASGRGGGLKDDPLPPPGGALDGDPARVAYAGWARDRPSSEDDPEPEDVASALVLLALGFRSGLPTSKVLEAVASVVDHEHAGDERSLPRGHGAVPAEAGVSRDLRQVAAALHWGASDAEAWGSVGAVWSGAARAVAIAHRAGLPPGPLLLSAADELRREALEGLELAAARVGVRLVAPLGLVLLPAFCLTTVVPLVVALGGQMLAG